MKGITRLWDQHLNNIIQNNIVFPSCSFNNTYVFKVTERENIRKHFHMYFLSVGSLQQVEKGYSLAILEPVNNGEGCAFDFAFKGDVMAEDNRDFIWRAGTYYGGWDLNKDILSWKSMTSQKVEGGRTDYYFYLYNISIRF